jgi:hypothetical protein
MLRAVVLGVVGAICAPVMGASQIVFLLDGSGSVSAGTFAMQRRAVRDCVCAPGTPLDGSVSVAVVQFSQTARIEIPLTVLDSPGAAGAFCDQVDSLVRLNGGTRILPGLELARDVFEDADPGADRSLVILTDTIVFDERDLVEDLAEDLRTGDDPVRLCAGMTDETIAFDVALFNLLCNVPGSPGYEPDQPGGRVERVEFVWQFQPLCTGCVAVCEDPGGPDCDGDGVGDACEPDCDANGVPDECDILADPMRDLNGNGLLDLCEEDCNGNGLADFLDIQTGLSTDCNGDAVPDDCQGAADCNGNGLPDFCEIAEGLSGDCNLNGVPDECESGLFPVVTRRLLALEGETPPVAGLPEEYGVLGLGVAVDDRARVWFGDVGDGGGGRGGPGPGRVFEFDLSRGAAAMLLREGDLIPGGETWLDDPEPGCGAVEAFLRSLPSDLPSSAPLSGNGAIRGVSADGTLLVAGTVLIDSELCAPLGTRRALLAVTPGLVDVLYREDLDVCLLGDGLEASPARPRLGGGFAHAEVQANPGFAWLITPAADGGCVVARSGDPSPDGGVYQNPSFSGLVPGPYRVTARHATGDQTLFFASSTVSGELLVLDEGGAQTLIARNGTPVSIGGQPLAALVLRSTLEEGADVGVLTGAGPDVVFRGEVGGVEALFVWEWERNADPTDPFVRAIVAAADLESLPGLRAAPGSVRLSHPVLGGPCGSCGPGPGMVAFKAAWRDEDSDEDRTGLFAYAPGHGLIPVAVPGERLPPPRDDLAFAESSAMVAGFDLDASGRGTVVFAAMVGLADHDPVPASASGVFAVSIKPGACDLRPPFGLLDLEDIIGFVTGMMADDPAADFAEPFGTFDLGDIVGFVGCFSAGCP